MKRHLSLVLISLLLFAIACITPAMRNEDGEGIPGWVALMGGWIPPMTLPWSANLLLLLGLAFYGFGKYGIARIAGLIALGVSPTTLTMYAGHQLHVGYLLWQASFLAFAAGAWLACRQSDVGMETRSSEEDAPSSRKSGET